MKLWDLRKLKNFKTLQLEDGYEVGSDKNVWFIVFNLNREVKVNGTLLEMHFTLAHLQHTTL